MHKTTLHKTVLIGAILLAATATYECFAMWQAKVSRPAKIAWVDIEKVFDSLNSRAQADRDLNTMRDELYSNAESRRQAITAKQEEVAVLQPSTDEFNKAQEDLVQMTLEYQGYQEFARQKLEREKARILGKIYDDIRSGAMTLADRNGYDYVVVNDSIGKVEASTEQDMNRQISARRLLYATDGFDVTAELIEQLNQ